MKQLLPYHQSRGRILQARLEVTDAPTCIHLLRRCGSNRSRVRSSVGLHHPFGEYDAQRSRYEQSVILAEIRD